MGLVVDSESEHHPHLSTWKCWRASIRTGIGTVEELELDRAELKQRKDMPDRASLLLLVVGLVEGFQMHSIVLVLAVVPCRDQGDSLLGLVVM